MEWCGIEIPEPFAGALLGGADGDVRMAETPDAAARLGRGLVRAAVGDDAGAREDLEAVREDFGSVATVELAMLDIRRRGGIAAAGETAREILADAASEPGPLRARALHVLGLAEGKLRNTADALDALLEANRLYADADARAPRAQVQDTIGMLFAARGRLDQAVYWYALSLADKALIGDRLGMAITLGNLGRLHLRAGRNEDALTCFQRDLELAEQLGDMRGQTRMHEDIGRAHMAAGNYDAAAAGFARSIRMADEHGYADMAFFAWRDLALLQIEHEHLGAAVVSLKNAGKARPPGGEAYFDVLLEVAGSALALARGDADALERLEQTVRDLQAIDMPDLEIPARVRLGRAYHEAGQDAHAEQYLMGALAQARRDGYARYLTPINEALSALGMVEGVLADETRGAVDAEEAAPDAYLLRQKLGEGAFGEVYRAYDPERHREVAFKRIFLQRVYDPEQRKQLQDSARLELEAASRVRHPGVVRVYAVGTESDGGMYVVQDFVQGRSLRDIMDETPQPEPEGALETLAEIAWALQALHDAGVVHRDLKPDNVLVRPDGTPVLVDFGIAHLAANENPDDAGFIVGTLRYMAPEQMQGQVVDHRADLYAFGAMAFEWLAGETPIEPVGASMIEQLRSILHAEPKLLSAARDGLSPTLESTLAALLEKDPRRRPQDAASVARIFRSVADGA